jgi:hypothetical protein
MRVQRSTIGLQGLIMTVAAVRWAIGALLICVAADLLFARDHVQAGDFKSPEECLAYSGDAHLNCLFAYIEIQQGKITRLQEELNTQKATAGQLQDQPCRL